MAARWDGDERGHGVGDATTLVSGATELVAAFGAASWVAEQPDRHLGPHVANWCRLDGRFAISGSRVDEAGAYVLELTWRGESAGVGQVRAAVFALVGSFAESATYVRQRWVRQDPGAAAGLRFEIGTGELAADSRFAPHGHTVLITVAGVR